jgi:Antitoxin VbhA
MSHLPTISGAEAAVRRQAVESANASMRLSGMEMPADMRALDEEYTAGRLSLEEYGSTVRGWYGLR